MKNKMDVFDQMASKWPSAIVARTNAGIFSGGLLSAKYLANLDSQGLGPKRISVGRKIGYPVADFCEWLRERATQP